MLLTIPQSTVDETGVVTVAVVVAVAVAAGLAVTDGEETAVAWGAVARMVGVADGVVREAPEPEVCVAACANGVPDRVLPCTCSAAGLSAWRVGCDNGRTGSVMSAGIGAAASVRDGSDTNTGTVCQSNVQRSSTTLQRYFPHINDTPLYCDTANLPLANTDEPSSLFKRDNTLKYMINQHASFNARIIYCVGWFV